MTRLQLPFRRTAPTFPACGNQMPENRGPSSQKAHDDGSRSPNTVAQSGGRKGITVKAGPWSDPETWAQAPPDPGLYP